MSDTVSILSVALHHLLVGAGISHGVLEICYLGRNFVRYSRVCAYFGASVRIGARDTAEALVVTRRIRDPYSRDTDPHSTRSPQHADGKASMGFLRTGPLR